MNYTHSAERTITLITAAKYLLAFGLTGTIYVGMVLTALASKNGAVIVSTIIGGGIVSAIWAAVWYALFGWFEHMLRAVVSIAGHHDGMQRFESVVSG